MIFTIRFMSRISVGLIGQRNLDTAEEEFIERNNILVYPGNTLKDGYQRKLEALVKAFKNIGVDHLFLHFDLDVIDSTEDPPVYAPHSNGLLKSDISNISLHLRNQFELAGISIANYIPEKDVQNAKGWIREIIAKLYQ